MDIHVTLSPDQSKAIAAQLERIAYLEQERARLIARMNRPHLVAVRFIRMQLIRLFN